MPHKHVEEIPAALEDLVTRLGELEVVFGTHVGPALAQVRATLGAAVAARDHGDVPAAIEYIGQAMDRLSALADDLDPAEAALMRGIAHAFRTALLRGDHAEAKRSSAVMLEKSGAVERKKE
jgi:hypothetical protein